ncbi:hypothetical protein Droror1_Dr00007073 [Drosera rotundifolia]
MALSKLVMISALVLFATVLANADIPVSGGGSSTKPAVGTPAGNSTKPAVGTPSGNFTKPAVGAVTPPIGPLKCGAACIARCSLSKRPNLCQRSCGACCFRCKCVPPGTSGNYDICPCYASLTTRGGRRKCP